MMPSHEMLNPRYNSAIPSDARWRKHNKHQPADAWHPCLTVPWTMEHFVTTIRYNSHLNSIQDSQTIVQKPPVYNTLPPRLFILSQKKKSNTQTISKTQHKEKCRIHMRNYRKQPKLVRKQRYNVRTSTVRWMSSQNFTLQINQKPHLLQLRLVG